MKFLLYVFGRTITLDDVDRVFATIRTHRVHFLAGLARNPSLRHSEYLMLDDSPHYLFTAFVPVELHDDQPPLPSPAPFTHRVIAEGLIATLEESLTSTMRRRG